MKIKIAKNIGLYFLLIQNLFSYNFWRTTPNNYYARNITLNSNRSFNSNLNFSQNAFNKKLFTQHKLEDLSDAPGLKISHDGKLVASIATNDESKLVLSILDAFESNDKKEIILNGSRIYKYGFCFNNEYLWYLADKQGDERYQLYSVNIKTNAVFNIIQGTNLKIDILKTSPLFKDEILIKINKDLSAWYDIYKINIKTGKLDLIFKNNEKFINFISDSNLRIRFAEKITEDSIRKIYKKTEIGWELFDTIPFEDYQATELLHISADGGKLYLKDSRNQNTAALIEINLENNFRKILAVDESKKADLSKILINPQTLEVEAACFTFEKDKWIYFNSFDQNTKKFFENISSQNNCCVDIICRSDSDYAWIISLSTPKDFEYYLYQKEQLAITKFIGGNYFQRKTVSKIIQTRDGLSLVAYLTLPIVAEYSYKEKYEPLPMIIIVHGGPWSRDNISIANKHQFLAEEGYAVLSVNFRGSTGFGKSFLNASIGEWGGKMLDDLITSAHWAIDQGIADPFKIGICGDSFGGYATLAALTFAPEVFACGISFAGISNLATLIQNLPYDWTAEKDWFRKMLGGDERDIDGESFLRSQSPLFFANKIKRPLLIGHGCNDPRVKKSESETIFKKMKNNKLPATYAIFPDEGHFLSKPANDIMFQKLTLKFFAKHLKNKEYKIPETYFKNSSILLEDNSETQAYFDS